MKITLYASGCEMCGGFAQALMGVKEEFDIENLQIEKVCNTEEIIKAGVVAPAVAIDGEVVISGKVPDIEDLKKIIKERVEDK